MKIQKVCALFAVLLAASCTAERPKLPAEKELRSLARESILTLNLAIQAKDFSLYYSQISQMWQKQSTPEKLAEAFAPYLDKRIDLAFVAPLEPVFNPSPRVQEDGVLLLEGYYLAPPNRLSFRLSYVKEKGEWKQLGISVNLAPDPTAREKMPGKEEGLALLFDSLGAFNRAVQTRSFVAFHEQIASLWRQQTTPEKLQALFQSFIDQKADITPVLTMEPYFEPQPSINEDGLLEMNGGFATKPSELRFQLAYVYEAPSWRLVKINIKIGGQSASDK